MPRTSAGLSDTERWLVTSVWCISMEWALKPKGIGHLQGLGCGNGYLSADNSVTSGCEGEGSDTVSRRG